MTDWAVELFITKLKIMTIVVNQQPQQFDQALTLQTLLQQLGKAQQLGIAVAVNNKVVSKTQWTNHQLQDQDHVTIITATQGG